MPKPQRARLEDLARLLDGRLGDVGTAVRLDDDDALMGERLQRGPDDRAAGAEQGADLVLRETGSGRQPMVEDRGQQRIANARRAVAEQTGTVAPAGVV